MEKIRDDLPKVLDGLDVDDMQLHIIRQYVHASMACARDQRNMLFSVLLLLFANYVVSSIVADNEMPFIGVTEVLLSWIPIVGIMIAVFVIIVKQIIRNKLINGLADSSLLPAPAVARLREITWCMDLYVLMEPYYFLEKLFRR
ncbi:hypothetical protein [Janthinobacterium sp. FW305-128]|uniref:hypothetical protein n=1 Tax=Janthinobacterium sp. FW305-128 TaxID=2775055 RepID=UPI001E32CFD7|nr:hypothetical protein [Janthinobacterium sp. FW305-128]MCC7684737.1 hypothetical protein [Janthinobacterium sp. FW305-128]